MIINCNIFIHTGNCSLIDLNLFSLLLMWSLQNTFRTSVHGRKHTSHCLQCGERAGIQGRDQSWPCLYSGGIYLLNLVILLKLLKSKVLFLEISCNESQSYCLVDCPICKNPKYKLALMVVVAGKRRTRIWRWWVRTRVWSSSWVRRGDLWWMERIIMKRRNIGIDIGLVSLSKDHPACFCIRRVCSSFSRFRFSVLGLGMI